MTNKEYIDCINKALERLEKFKLEWEIQKEKGQQLVSNTTPNFGTKRLCTQCLAAYVGGPVCTCGNRYTSEL